MPRLDLVAAARLTANAPSIDVADRHKSRLGGRVVARAAHLVACWCLVAAFSGSAAHGADGWVTVLHTNDVHGQYDLREATWRDDRALVGGFRALSGTIEALRAELDPILIDAGDLMSGDPLTVIDYEGVMGGGAMAFLNAMRYDAMALGNHEFDNGRPEVLALLGMAEFPVLSGNLWIDSTDEPFLPAHVVVERDGVRIGILGLMLDDLAEVVAAEPIQGIRVEPMADAAAREVAILDPMTDLVVVVCHAGLDDARALAGAVPGIDVIIAGHDHRRTREPIVENGVLIVESGSGLTNVGKLDVQVDNDRVLDHRYELILLEEAAAASATPAVQQVHDICHAAVQAEFGVEIATLVSPFRRQGRQESNVGNWVTDAMRETARVDFAVTNSSGLRADVDAGPLTRLDIHRLYPFHNLLCTFECSGQDILTFARHNTLGALVEGKQSLVQVSGLSWAYAGDGSVSDVRVGGEPVDAARTYVGTTSDFVLFSQVEKYLGFVPGKRERTTRAVFDVLADFASAEGTIDARVDGRFRKLAPDATATGRSMVTGE